MTITDVRLFEFPIVTFPECSIARYFVMSDSKSTNVPLCHSKSYPMTRGRINQAWRDKSRYFIHGQYYHRLRISLFFGDYVDRGPQNSETITLFPVGKIVFQGPLFLSA
jgi:hypothetical protein